MLILKDTPEQGPPPLSKEAFDAYWENLIDEDTKEFVDKIFPSSKRGKKAKPNPKNDPVRPG